MNIEEYREPHAAGTSNVVSSAVTAREEAHLGTGSSRRWCKGQRPPCPRHGRPTEPSEKRGLAQAKCCTITESCESRSLKIAFRGSSSNGSAGDANLRVDGSAAARFPFASWTVRLMRTALPSQGSNSVADAVNAGQRQRGATLVSARRAR